MSDYLKLPKKIMLLGSGELGKEFVIAAKRLGNYIIAVDRYENAPYTVRFTRTRHPGHDRESYPTHLPSAACGLTAGPLG